MNQTFRIHMADDDTRHCAIYESTIRDALGEVDISFSHDGKAALEACLQEPYPDLVILDLDMPEMKGTEVLRELKQRPQFIETPIIVLTGHSDLTQQMQLLEYGAEDFIEKGAAPGIFIARIRTQMRHKLALNRLEQLALDRDMFAAGVLHDIRGIESTLVNLCQGVKAKVKEDHIANHDIIAADLVRLREESRKLGAYASDVIKSVRESGKKAEFVEVDLEATANWSLKVLEQKAGGQLDIAWVAVGDLRSLYADEKFLKLSLLAMIQFAHKRNVVGDRLNLEISQRDSDQISDRKKVITEIRTSAASPKDCDRLFHVRSDSVSVEELEMPMVARLMQNMGGKISAWEDSGKLVFGFELPSA